MRKDYLAAYLAQAPANFQIPTPNEVSKVSEVGFDTSDTSQRVESPKNQGRVVGGFDTFDTASRVGNPEIQRPSTRHRSVKPSAEISRNVSSNEVPKVSKPFRSKQSTTIPKQRRKVWRRAPYWQACLEATRLPSGALDLESCDLLYAALVLRDEHLSDEVCEMLRAVTPQASTDPEYCARVVERVALNPTSYITTELAAKYAAAHPFARELRLSAPEMVGVQVIEGVQ